MYSIQEAVETLSASLLELANTGRLTDETVEALRQIEPTHEEEPVTLVPEDYEDDEELPDPDKESK